MTATSIDTRTASAKLKQSKLSNQLETLAANVDLTSLKLALKGAASFDITEAVTDIGPVSRTILGASTVTVTVNDSTGEILNSGVFGTALQLAPDLGTSLLTSGVKAFTRPVDINLDGLWFRLVALKIPDPANTRTLQLIFEDREVAILRSYPKQGDPNTYRAWDVTNFNRAQVIRWLIEEPSEVKGGIRWVFSPSIVKDAQFIASSADKLDALTRLQLRFPGITADPTTTVTVKGQPASPQQKALLQEVMDVGESMSAPSKLLIVSVMVVTQESDATNLPPSPTGTGAFQQFAPGFAASGDVSRDAASFFAAAVTANAAHPSASYGLLASIIQRPAAYLNGSDPAGAAYSQWQPEAEQTVLAYGGGIAGQTGTATAGGNPALPPGATPVIEGQAAQFTRGTIKVVGTKKIAVRENNWACAQRLAAEVGWRVYCVSGTVYVTTDEDLLRSSIQATYSRDTPGVNGIGFEIDTAKANALVTIQCDATRWGNPPGTCAAVAGMGPIDGRWIVQTIVRTSLFHLPAVITLSKPQPVLLDAESASPIQASGIVIGETAAAVGLGGSVVTVAKQALVNSANYTYSEKLAHRGPGGIQGLGSAPPVYYDCSSFVTAIYKAAGAPDPSGQSYKGESNTGTLIAGGTPVQKEQLQPGDLVFYGGTLTFPQHVAMFVGNSQVIQMGGPPGTHVQEERLDLGGTLPIIACCTYARGAA